MLAAARAGDLPRMRSARRVPTCERCARRRHQSAPRMPMASCRRRRRLCDRPSIFIAPSVSASRRVRSGPGRPRATLANARGGSGSDVRVWRSALPPVCAGCDRRRAFGSRRRRRRRGVPCRTRRRLLYRSDMLYLRFIKCALYYLFFSCCFVERRSFLLPSLAYMQSQTHTSTVQHTRAKNALT